MTSLIWGIPYLAHKGVTKHRQEKQRVKNYERWEGLRDEYDEQRKVARESRSLDIQRTGAWDMSQQDATGQYRRPSMEEDRSFISLRDQQEANDARTGWRPQESWEPPRTQLQAQMTGQAQQIHPYAQRHVSMTPAMTGQPTGLPLKAQKTGATWDEGLPAPLAVSRQQFDDYDYSQRYHSPSISSPTSREQSQSRGNSVSRQASVSNGVSRTQPPSGLRESTPAEMPDLQRRYSPPEVQTVSMQEMPKNEFGFVEPARHVPGGRMAELIERGY